MSAPASTTASAPIHGVTYNPAFLAALPVLQQRLYPHQPIRALSAPQFSRVHLNYCTSHAPDGVLFPFLHGLEGDNEAQNAFFAASPQAHGVPRFRGLVWVACEDDADPYANSSESDDLDEDEDSELDDDSSSTSSLESLGPISMDMDVDVPVSPPMELDQLDPASISEPSSPLADPCSVQNKSSALDAPPVVLPLLQRSHSRPPHAHTAPALLTSSFRARELLQVHSSADGAMRCTFVEPRVPDGISLRNFGIQVPIYATLSDIVVYSPKGNTRSALALAVKFKDAIEAKRAERCERYPDSADALVAYNVFVLDSSPAEMTTVLSHLVQRVEDVPFAHTDGVDAYTEGEVHPAGDSEDEVKSLLYRANTVDFALREKEEMRNLTQASEIITIADPTAAAELDDDALSGSTTVSHWDPSLGQVFLGNSNDVPMLPDQRVRMRRPRPHGSPYADEDDEEEDAFDWATNNPAHGLGYDICIECHDFAPFPTMGHVRAAEEHLTSLERRWAERCVQEMGRVGEAEAHTTALPVRPPPSAGSVIHLPFPSSPPSTVGTLSAFLPFIAFLESLLHPPAPLTLASARAQLAPHQSVRAQTTLPSAFAPSSLPPPSSFPSSFFPGTPPPPVPSSNVYTRTRSTSATFPSPSTHAPSTPSSSSVSSRYSSPSHGSRASSVATSHTSASLHAAADERMPFRTRPLKILIYSADGYTESSVLALSLLMYLRRLALPAAYLTLQVEKRRSFFVYSSDLGVLRKIEGRIEREREKGGCERMGGGVVMGMDVKEKAMVQSPVDVGGSVESAIEYAAKNWSRNASRPSAKSVSFAMPPKPRAPAQVQSQTANVAIDSRPLRSQSENDSEMLHFEVAPGTVAQVNVEAGRPRASTMPSMPLLPSSVRDHSVWFNDPRFDGSFPSRVLPFLYLGNLNHATNAYMLHALGITHVVSVGECALIPPPNLEASASVPACVYPGPGAQFVLGKGPHGQGSLWIEEREGRIKVLDIKGVCDDGIDTLEPQLEPICEWIDRARQEGGKVLVHCRVGVSRSATVTIAYVMKHLGLPLVDAYLIVRSRRLSVLIQPNMRLLYNLLGWEVKLARQRAGDHEDKLRAELARCLNWPCLAKEVHKLNEKYLH